MKAKTGIVIAAALGAYFVFGKRGTAQSPPVADSSAEEDAQDTLDRLLGDWSVLDAIGREVAAGDSFPIRFEESPYRMTFLDPSGNPSVVVEMVIAEVGGDRIVAHMASSPTAPPMQTVINFLGEDEATISLLRGPEEITYAASRIPGGFIPARTPPPVMPSAPSRRYGAKGATTTVSRVSSLQERALSPNPLLSAGGSSRVAVGVSTATSMQATSFSWRDYGPIPDLGLPVRRPWAPDERSLLLRAFNNWAAEAQQYGVQPGIYREPFMRAFSAGDYFTAQRIFSEATHAEAAFMEGTRGRTMTGTGCGCGCGGACGCGGGQGCSGSMKSCGCGG
jgi:hypothetical protein